MTTLWMKFPDEALGNSVFSPSQQERLESVFSTRDTSPWQQALKALRLSPTPPTISLLKWRAGVPYFNWNCMIETLLGRAGRVIKTTDGYSISGDYGMKSLWALMKVHWKIARFLPAPHEQMDDITRSIALGIVLQSLLLRLGADMPQLAAWLADPQQAPSRHQLTLRQIQAVQIERTNLSHAWKALIGSHDTSTHHDALPEYFWDDGTELHAPMPQKTSISTGTWAGLPVCAGERQGVAVAFDAIPTMEQFHERTAACKDQLILVFRTARPETTEYFSYASAVLFASGGVMSHACTVAREYNLPAVTGLGADFLDYIKQNENMHLHVDGATGEVKIAAKTH